MAVTGLSRLVLLVLLAGTSPAAVQSYRRRFHTAALNPALDLDQRWMHRVTASPMMISSVPLRGRHRSV